MTTIATGVAKRLTYKKETTWNTAAGTSGGQSLRRTSSTLALKKATYESNEIRTDYQRNDMRHGVQSVAGVISGELSPGTYKDFMAAFVRAAFATVTSIASLSLTMAGSGPTYTVTRGSGSWITDGIKVGDVVKISAGSVNAANLNKHLFVVAETATVLTVMPLNGVALVAEGPVASCTLAVPGKKAKVPTTGHTDDSFSIEHWHADIAQSELYTGCKLNEMNIELPPTGLAKITFPVTGGGMTPATSQYFTSPTAETSTGALAAVNGILILQGAAVALVTGLTLNGKGNMNYTDPSVGSNSHADIVEGRVIVDGQMTVLFADATIRNYFVNETEVALAVALSASSAAAADFVGFSLPRIKVGGADNDDGEKALIQTLPFSALFNNAGGAATTSEQTTFAIQDSQA